MKPGKDTLWSTDIFGDRAVAAPVAAPAGPAAAAVNPDQERAYLRFGRPVLQALAVQPGRAARRSRIREVLVKRDEAGFDFDDFCRALAELERRSAILVAERDSLAGDHLYRLTDQGALMAA